MRLAPMITSVVKVDDALAEYRVHGTNTYAKNRFTLETVTREIQLGERLWESQQHFLAQLSPGLARSSVPLTGRDISCC